MRNGLEIDEEGTKRWYLDDKLHREDGPAEVWTHGSKCWYVHGALHREDGPAVEYGDGATDWYLNGKYLGMNIGGFWALWDRLSTEQQNNVNLHRWLAKYT